MAAKIKDGLFLGDEDTSKDPEFLDLNKISNLINVATREVANVWSNHGLVYLNYSWEDRPDYNLFERKEDILIGIIEFIDTSLRHGVSVLIFSKRGVGRCAVATIAYLMFKYHWGYEKTLAYVSSKKLDIELNEGFEYQLCVLEKKIQEFRQKILQAAATYFQLDKAQQELLTKIDTMRWNDWDASYLELENQLGLRHQFDAKFTQYMSTHGAHSKKDLRFMNALKSAPSDEAVLLNSYNNSRSALTTLPGPYLYAMAAPKSFRLKFNLEKTQVITINSLNSSMIALNSSFSGRSSSSGRNGAANRTPQQQQLSTPTMHSPSLTAKPLRSAMKGSRLRSLQSGTTANADVESSTEQPSRISRSSQSIVNQQASLSSSSSAHAKSQNIVIDAASSSPTHDDFLRYSSTLKLPPTSVYSVRPSGSFDSNVSGLDMRTQGVNDRYRDSLQLDSESKQKQNTSKSINSNKTVSTTIFTSIHPLESDSKRDFSVEQASSESAEARLAKLVRDIEQSRKERHLRLTNTQLKQSKESISSSSASPSSGKYPPAVSTQPLLNPFAAATVSPPSYAIANKILNGNASTNSSGSGSGVKKEFTVLGTITQSSVDQEVDAYFSALYNTNTITNTNASTPSQRRRSSSGAGSGSGSKGGRTSTGTNESTISPRRLSSSSSHGGANVDRPSSGKKSVAENIADQSLPNLSWLYNASTNQSHLNATSLDPYFWLLENNYASHRRSSKKGLSSSPRVSDESKPILPTSVPKVYRHGSPQVSRVSPNSHKLLSVEPTSNTTSGTAAATNSPHQYPLYSSASPKNYSSNGSSSNLSATLNALLAADKEASQNRVFLPRSSTPHAATGNSTSKSNTLKSQIKTESNGKNSLTSSHSRGNVTSGSRTISPRPSSATRASTPSAAMPRAQSPSVVPRAGIRDSASVPQPSAATAVRTKSSPRANVSSMTDLNASGNYNSGDNSRLLARSSYPSSRDGASASTNVNVSTLKASKSATTKMTRSASVDKLRTSHSGSPRASMADIETQLRTSTGEMANLSLNASSRRMRSSTPALSSSLRAGTPSRIWR